MRRGKRDSNHMPIVRELRACGLSVSETHSVGCGFPDLVVSGYSPRVRSNVTVLVEVKTDTGRLEKSQIEFHRTWRGPIIVATSAADVLDWYGAVRR